jgi:hypothetical protein
MDDKRGLNHMVARRDIRSVGHFVVFGLLLGGLGVVVTMLAHFRIGLIVLRGALVVFNLFSTVYVLSRAGQYFWEKSRRIADLLPLDSKESAHVECP